MNFIALKIKNEEIILNTSEIVHIGKSTVPGDIVIFFRGGRPMNLTFEYEDMKQLLIPVEKPEGL